MATQEKVDLYHKRIPYCYEYGGIYIPGLESTQQRVAAVQDMKVEDDDVIIAAYPRCGVAWLVDIVSLIIHHGDTENPERPKALEVDSKGRVWRAFMAGFYNDVRYFCMFLFGLWWVIRQFLFGAKTKRLNPKARTPDSPVCQNMNITQLPAQLLPKEARNGKGKIIYLSNNPKDNAVNFLKYHNNRKLSFGPKPYDWDEFLEMFLEGTTVFGSWFDHVLGYCRLELKNENVFLIQYEQLIKDLENQVSKLCDFLAVELSNETQAEIAKLCKNGPYTSKKKTKASAGYWKTYFTDEQNEKFEKVYNEKLRSIEDCNIDYDFDLEQ